ncbi:VQ motif-containing protein 11-like [Cucurbita moschata]|uniref:VQ motif-containing protein 11-like n=1 Tax=Cucurbita moschata TaxID=3662 RepID=A0A6J1F605_CUCMO|nr:VQ motif-containing protein 11-like [Cucurbita moschata]
MEKHLTTISSPPPPPLSTSPTTFVQADPNSFRDLVQKLTGFSGHSEKLPVTHLSKLSSSNPLPPATDHHTGPRRSPFKLQERRHTIRKLEIKLGPTGIFKNSPSHPRRFDSPIPSPVTPLAAEFRFLRKPSAASPLTPPVTAEDKAIADGGFYLHPSPRSSQPPELLNLFPSKFAN